MRLGLFAIIVACLLLRWLPSLPNSVWLGVLLLCAPVLLFTRLYWLGLGFLAFIWSCSQVQSALDQQLDSQWQGNTLWVEGTVVGLPHFEQDGKHSLSRFLLTDNYSRRTVLPKLIQVNWYQGPPVKAGQRWRLALQLKGIQGLANPHLADKQQWLFAQGIGAVANVKTAQQLAPAQGVGKWRDAFRQQLFRHLPADKSIAALIVGDGNQLSRERWQALIDTGTVHLMVISGQHIGIVAGLVYALIAWLGRRRFWPHSISWLLCACLSAWFAAFIYAWLAGFTVPVQRALLMLSVVLVWRVRSSHLNAWTPYLWALALVLLLDPLVVFLNGFWLSFAVVAVLIMVFSNRLGRPSFWQFLVSAQWAAFIGLFPVLLALGLTVSPLSPLANMLAIPFVSFVLIPLSLLGAACLPVPSVAGWLLGLASWLMYWFFQVLQQLAQWQPAWQAPALSALGLICVLFAAFICLLPRGLIPRYWALLLLLPLAFVQTEDIPHGQAKVTVLDVGQGLSVLVQTQQYSLLYDAGNRFMLMDMGAQVVVPVLSKLGIERLDKVIISHADMDHVGGLASIQAKIPIDDLASGEPDKVKHSKACPRRTWHWDGVEFNQWQWRNARSANQKSCVLWLRTAQQSLLMTGDLDIQGEFQLMQDHPELTADWLVLGHHGSRTSTSGKFLRQLQVKGALISRGRYNQYQHPHTSVLQQLSAHNVQVFDSTLHGAITIRLKAHSSDVTYVRQQLTVWRTQP